MGASVHRAHAVPIEITNNGMDYTSNKVQFTVLPESNVTLVHPSFGAVGASTSVTVHGSGFVFSRSLYCRFGLLSVAAMYVNSTTVVCTAPDAAEGVVDVRVSSMVWIIAQAMLHMSTLMLTMSMMYFHALAL